MAHQRILEFATFDRGSRDITTAIADVVAQSGVRCGVAHAFVQHTGCSLIITEHADPSVRHGLETIIRRLAPDGDPAYTYHAEGPDAMAAYARSMLTSTGLSVPVGDGRLLLGASQGIFLWEHRVAEQQRSVVVTVIGD